MSSEILRGDRAQVAEPMPWMVVAGEAGDERARLYPPAVSEARGVDPELAVKAAMKAAIDRAAAEAREAGRREGETAARNAAQAETQRSVEELAGAIRQLSEVRPRLRLEAEADLVRLALSIAKRVVGRELTVDPDAVAGLVRTALERLRLQEAIRVRLHSQFQEAVRLYLAKTPGAAHIEVLADPTLDRGAILFETLRGRLDVSVETQFSEIERGLTDRLRGRGL